MRDIEGALTVVVLVEYLQVWDLVDGLILQPGVLDQHCGKLTQSRVYSSKSAYATFFGCLWLGFWELLLLPKSQKPTKGVETRSCFFRSSYFWVVQF